MVARIVLQDFTGVPLLVDLAAMRHAVAKLNKNPKLIEPLVPVDLVVDHSVQVDVAAFRPPCSRISNSSSSVTANATNFSSGASRPLKPSGGPSRHRDHLEYLAKGVLSTTLDGETITYPDTLVGTDSHDHDQWPGHRGLGRGRHRSGGGHARPAGLFPHARGCRRPHDRGAARRCYRDRSCAPRHRNAPQGQGGRQVRRILWPRGASLPLPDRATIANMAPEYGATMGYFPVDAESVNYLRATGRTKEQVEAFESYFKAQKLFGIPTKADGIIYSSELELDLADASRAWPGRSVRRTASPCPN